MAGKQRPPDVEKSSRHKPEVNADLKGQFRNVTTPSAT
jgi:hypothetical protein